MAPTPRRVSTSGCTARFHRCNEFLLALPDGLALVEEGVHALAEVLAHVAHQHEVVAFAVRHRGAQAQQRFLGRLQSERRVGGDFARELLGALQQRRLVGRELHHQSRGERLIGLDQPRAEHDLLDQRRPDEIDQPRITGERQTIAQGARDGKAELDGARGDAQVAARGDARAAAGAGAGDRGDRRGTSRSHRPIAAMSISSAKTPKNARPASSPLAQVTRAPAPPSELVKWRSPGPNATQSNSTASEVNISAASGSCSFAGSSASKPPNTNTSPAGMARNASGSAGFPAPKMPSAADALPTASSTTPTTSRLRAIFPCGDLIKPNDQADALGAGLGPRIQVVTFVVLDARCLARVLPGDEREEIRLPSAT